MKRACEGEPFGVECLLYRRGEGGVGKSMTCGKEGVVVSKGGESGKG